MSYVRRSVVVAADILETSKLGKPLRQQVLQLILQHLRADPTFSGSYESNVYWLGNSLAFAQPIDIEVNRIQPVGLPFYALVQLVRLQANLSLLGTWLSGVVTIGSVYSESGILFGSGFDRAQQLKNQLTHSPRLVIDSVLLHAIENDHLLRNANHSAQTELSYIQQLLHRGSDALWFIDYLQAMERQLPSTIEYLSFLQSHAQCIMGLREHIEELDREAMLLNWLTTYHNELVHTLWEDEKLSDIQRDSLQITGLTAAEYDFAVF